jgi:phenylacetate-CoA ligase
MKEAAIEYSSPEEILRLQEAKLRETVAYVYQHSPYYQRLFKFMGILPSDIRHIKDLPEIPFTDKEVLQEYNADFLCVPPERIVDYITTSGTLGDPVTFALTDKDLDRLAYNEKISFRCAGMQAGDIVQLMTTLDKRFMAGLAYFLGLRALGAGVIRVGNGIPELQWDTIQRIKPNTIVCVPSFILHIINYAELHAIDYRNSSIKKIICIGENLREQDFTLNLLGQRIRDKWDVALYSTYASTEMATSFTECECGCGGHHHPELILCELIDEQGDPIEDDRPGELLITTFGVEGMPLLRFKTGDLLRFHKSPCTCGRTSMRLGPVIGRTHQMIKFKGTTLYPPSIFDVLDHTPYVDNYVVVVSTDENGNDAVRVRLGVPSPLVSNVSLVKDIKDRFRARIRVAPEVELCTVAHIQKITMPGISRKAVKFIDNRKSKL